MASCNIKKLQAGQAYMVLEHNTRWKEKDDVTYSNTNIDPKKSYLNQTILSDESYQNETAKMTYNRLKNRVAEIDLIKPPKRRAKNRIEFVCFDIPCPTWIDDKMAFFKIAQEEFTKMCGGKENVSNMEIHFDEIHLYMDTATNEIRESLPHGHMVGIPCTEEKGVNAKSWATKASFARINKSIHDRCLQELGSPFLDGSGHKSSDTVESLKIKSKGALNQKVSILNQQINFLKEEEQTLQAKIDDAKTTLKSVTAESESTRMEIEKLKSTYSSAAEKYNELVSQYNHLYKKFHAILDVLKQLSVSLDKNILDKIQMILTR